MAKNKQNAGGKFKGSKNKKGIKGKRAISRKEKHNIADDSRLAIRNLSFKTTENSLKSHFEIYGRVSQIFLPKKPNGDLTGSGYVQFENVEEAKRALKARNGQSFLGRSLQIEIVAEQKLNRKTPFEVKMDTMSEIPLDEKPEISEQDPFEDDSSSNNKPTKRNFQKQKTHGKENSKIEVEPKEKVVRKARLIVRNISFKATEETLKKHFQPYGEVLETTLLKKTNGDLIGCGFIQFQNVNMATKAILETNAKPFLGRPIHVDWAIAKNKYMAHLTQQQDELEYLKNDVKEEPESDNENDVKFDTSNISIKKESDDDDVEMDSDSNQNESDDENADNSDGDIKEEDDEFEDDEDMDSKSDIKKDSSGKQNRVSANDAEDGRTIFLKNIAFSVTSDDLDTFAKQFGEINYALVCIDKFTEHSKGSGFIRFKAKEDADIFLSAAPERLLLNGQNVQPFPALLRDNTKKTKNSNQPKDSRNLYLIKEGLILANTKAASGVSQSDMSKRLALEQKKSQLLRNLNRFISPNRLTIHNIPLHYTDENLRKLCLDMTNIKPFCLKECRIMKFLKGQLDASGNHMSKGYGFVTFTKHEDALSFLRRVNNNPSVFDKNNRPIVSFSIEDKAAINARNKRLEKSKIKNPLNPSYQPETVENEEESSESKDNKLKKNLKNNKFEKKGNEKKFKKNLKDTKKPQNADKMETEGDFVGEVAKSGKPLKMRNRYKLQMQANIHKENVKQEKRMQKMTKQKKVGRKERIKQPKQKQNVGERKKSKRTAEKMNEKNFTDLISKYKSKLLDNNSGVMLRKKWYEQDK